MKKSKKVIISIGLPLVILIASAGVYFRIWDPFFIMWIQSLLRSTTPNWKTYQTLDGQLSLESPFSISWDEKSNIKNGKVFRSTIGKTQFNRTGFTIHVISNKNTFKAPDSFLEHLLKPYNKNDEIFQEFFKNQQRIDRVVICSGMPATIAEYSYEDKRGNSFHSFDFYIANPNQYWNISLNSYEKNFPSFNEWSKRVIESVKIEAKNP